MLQRGGPSQPKLVDTIQYLNSSLAIGNIYGACNCLLAKLGNAQGYDSYDSDAGDVDSSIEYTNQEVLLRGWLACGILPRAS